MQLQHYDNEKIDTYTIVYILYSYYALVCTYIKITIPLVKDCYISTITNSEIHTKSAFYPCKMVYFYNNNELLSLSVLQYLIFNKYF